MSVFVEISGHYLAGDAAFSAMELRAYQDDDEAEFVQAGQARQANDQAYFLYLFTRFEAAVNASSEALLANRLAATADWADRRIWQAWSRVPVREIAFLSKVEVLVDKGLRDYATIKGCYNGRNTIAHGGVWQAQFYIPDIAEAMNDVLNRFVTS